MEPTIENNYGLAKPKTLIRSDVEGLEGVHISKQVVKFQTKDAVCLPGCHLEKHGISQDLVGLLIVQENIVGIVRLTKDDEQKIALVRVGERGDKFRYIDYLKSGIPCVIGRENVGLEDNTISRKHAMITMGTDNSLNIEDISMNGTTFIKFENEGASEEKELSYVGLKRFFKTLKKSNPERELELASIISNPDSWVLKGFIPSLIFEQQSESASGSAIFDYTRMPFVEESKNNTSLYEEPYSEESKLPKIDYKRELISRDTPINGGVYIVPGIQEAIVVDDGTKPKQGDAPVPITKAYESAYNTFLSKAKQTKVDVLRGIKPNQIFATLKAAHESAVEIIKYDLETAKLIEKVMADRKVNLREFMIEGKGVCRHQALLVGYLIERIIKEGYLGGSISVDRNRIPGKGGHAWARYTSDDGTVYVIDPAQNYVGTLRDSLKEADAWSYSRPEDRF